MQRSQSGEILPIMKERDDLAETLHQREATILSLRNENQKLTDRLLEVEALLVT